MDVLKQKGKDNKLHKKSLLKRLVSFEGGKARFEGESHITEAEYGQPLINGMHPYTNSYVKKFKNELKVEYRAVKRSEKHKLKKEIQELMEED